MLSAAASAIEADGDRVVVGARRAADQFLQQRMGDVAQFQQAEVGQHAEQASR